MACEKCALLRKKLNEATKLPTEDPQRFHKIEWAAAELIYHQNFDHVCHVAYAEKGKVRG